MSSLEKSMGTPSQTEEQEAYRDGVPEAGQPTRTALQRFSLELKEHVKGMYHLTNGRIVSTSASSCPKNKVLNRDCDVVSVQVHRLKKRAPWDSCTPSLLLLLYHHVLPPESPVHLAPRTRCGRLGASNEKKSVGSWFDAESAPLGGEFCLHGRSMGELPMERRES